ncbi:hypothetical protein O3M35_000996 [Rhynocoris fuscipes]
MSDQSIGNSILAKFQQISHEKELARNELVATKPFGDCTSSDLEKIEEAVKRKHEVDQNKRKKKSSDNNFHVGLSEKDVGITEFINSTSKGFTGIIKHRCSDFQVHEIDLEGNIVELKSTDLPTISEETDTASESEHRSILSEDVWKSLDEVVNSDSLTATYELDVTGKSKTERTLIHKAVKFVYGPKVFSNTTSKDDKTFLQIGKCKTKERACWPANRGPFLHFTLYKENIDTTNVVSLIARKLRVRTNTISYSGTKDKRGKTTQRMCIKRRPAEDLHRYKFYQFKLGDYCYKYDSLRLGDLKGNKFTIAIRNIEAPDTEINDSLKALKENGFINYYGLQRFGCSSVASTYMVGKAILLKDWKQAIEYILKPREGERCPEQIKKATNTWWKTKNAELAVKCLPKSDNSIEGKILRALKVQGEDQYYNALFAIPRNTMLLYVHAYQSLIWNKVVSKRIKEFGLKTLPGDLMYDGDEDIEAVKNDGDDVDKEDNDDNEDKDDENDKQETEEFCDKEKSAKTRIKLNVKKLSSEDVSKVSFNAIVLPLPGNDIEYPENVTKEWYSEFLKEDGLTLEHFKNASAAFSLYGSYRKIVGIAEELNWKICNYNSYDDDLILSDLDKLQNISLPEQPKDAQYKAVILDFKLKPSLYATMVLREVMKCETSAYHHAVLTRETHTNKDEHQDEKKVKTD